MHVALPEVDGRIGAQRRLVQGARASATRAPRPSSPGTGRWPTGSRIWPQLAGAWARLRATPAAERRVAIVLANYPSRDGRLANGVGLDMPASCVEVLRALRDAGYARRAASRPTATS